MATDTALSYCHDGRWSLQQFHVHSMCLAHTPFSLRPCACDKSTRCTYAHAYASIIMRIQGYIRSIASRLIRFVRNEKKNMPCLEPPMAEASSPHPFCSTSAGDGPWTWQLLRWRLVSTCNANPSSRNRYNRASRCASSTVQSASSRGPYILPPDSCGVLLLSPYASYASSCVDMLLSSSPFPCLRPPIWPLTLLPVFLFNQLSMLDPAGGRASRLVGLREA